MVSLCYNISIGSFTTSSVLRHDRKGWQWHPEAADAFLMWNRITVGGKKVVSKGLNNRRVAERALYLTVLGVTCVCVSPGSREIVASGASP